ncbi:hypothetical protein GCM10017744_098510 [Streptomyces antimycoticus]|uniref:Uncharacterized protein n=1 Tax=Streptomyces antimycoticus TaxID=68175 RepID=A0A4D4K1J7_9ACTN|nr:hypothetical protein SANT12839_010810 [Streptomyces antimycoticus]
MRWAWAIAVSTRGAPFSRISRKPPARWSSPRVDLAGPPPLHGLGLAASRNDPPSEAGRALRRTLLAAR